MSRNSCSKLDFSRLLLALFNVVGDGEFFEL